MGFVDSDIAGGFDTPTSRSVDIDFGTNANRVCVAYVTCATGAITDVTVNGVSMGSAKGSVATHFGKTEYMFIATVSGTGTLTVQVTIGSAGNLVLYAESWDGVDQTTIHRTVGTNTGSGTAWSSGALTSDAGDVGVTCGVAMGGSGTISATSPTVLRATDVEDNDSDSYSAAGEAPEGATTTLEGGISPSDTWYVIGASLIPAAGGGGSAATPEVAPTPDAESESHTGTTGSASETSFSWSHAIAAEADGLLVFTFVNANADNATGVVVDPTGVNKSLSAINGGRAVDTAGEPGDCKAWFINAQEGMPRGSTFTIRVDRTNNANVMYAVAFSVLGDPNEGGVSIVGSPVLLQENQALAEQAIDTGAILALRYAGVNSGLAAPPGAGASSTAGPSIDFGARGVASARETTGGAGSRSVGFSAAADDVAAVHVAVGNLRMLKQRRRRDHGTRLLRR